LTGKACEALRSRPQSYALSTNGRYRVPSDDGRIDYYMNVHFNYDIECTFPELECIRIYTINCPLLSTGNAFILGRLPDQTHTPSFVFQLGHDRGEIFGLRVYCQYSVSFSFVSWNMRHNRRSPCDCGFRPPIVTSRVLSYQAIQVAQWGCLGKFTPGNLSCFTVLYGRTSMPGKRTGHLSQNFLIQHCDPEAVKRSPSSP
jgi:hypothetical protein